MTVDLLLEMSKGWFSGFINTTAIPGTSYRSRIRQAIVYAIENRIISGGNSIRYSGSGESVVNATGYNFTFINAYDPPVSMEQMQEFPCVNLRIENEFCENSADTRLDQNQGLLHNSFEAYLDVFLHDVTDPALSQDKALADIQKYFGINYFIPDSDGEATAFNCYYLRSDPFGTGLTQPNCGITVEFKVWYRQKLTDPAQTG